MTPFLDKILQAGGAVATAMARFWGRSGRRASLRIETLKRNELEAERIDRLRNPRNYQGR
jgi:hypothetical protein